MHRASRDSFHAFVVHEHGINETKFVLPERLQRTADRGGIALSPCAKYPDVSQASEGVRLPRHDEIDRRMQRPRVSLPVHLVRCAGRKRQSVVGRDRQRTIQRRRHLVVTPEAIIADRNLLQDEEVLRIDLERTIEVLQSFLLFPLTTDDVAGQLRNTGVVR